MKIAIPEWQGRVSPVLDSSRNLKIFEVEAEGARLLLDFTWEQETVAGRISHLQQAGADVLICGAVSRPLEAAIVATGIEFIPQTCGNVNDIVAAFIKGLLTSETFLMPGCGRKNRRCRRRGRQDHNNKTKRRKPSCQQVMEQDQWEQDQ